MKIHFGENTTPSIELPRDFCAGICPLQLGVVLVFEMFHVYFRKAAQHSADWFDYIKSCGRLVIKKLNGPGRSEAKEPLHKPIIASGSTAIS